MINTYLIQPGFGNSDEHHWQTYFEKNLPNCLRINQQSWDQPICNDWIQTIDNEIINYNPESVVIITHSLGGIALAHWAKQYNTKIKGALIVAPPDLEQPFVDLNLDSFTPIPLQKLPFPSIVIGSTNDHWATPSRTELFAKSWGSELYLLENAGHINTASGFGVWSWGLELLLKNWQ